MAVYRGMTSLHLGVDNLAAVWAVLGRKDHLEKGCESYVFGQ